MVAKILIVEDEPVLQRILGSVLLDAGMQVWSVASAEEAFEHLENQAIDLVLSDKNLPQMNGLELLQKVRSEVDPMKPFVLVTGYPSLESAKRVLYGDGDGYLVKPFRSLKNVVDGIQDVLAKSQHKSQRSEAASRSRKAVAVLMGENREATWNLSQEKCFLLIDDEALHQKIHQALESQGAVWSSDAKEATLFFAARTDDLAASPLACAKILVNASPPFSALVDFIELGGGALLDPSLLLQSEVSSLSPWSAS